MSVRFGILALLQRQPMGVYQLRKDFETCTGGTWPVNIGQVYTTVQRLERDGLVESLGMTDDGIEPYRLTDAGQAAVAEWWDSTVERGKPERNELVIKLALAASAPGVDVEAIVQRQRIESLKALRVYTRLKLDADESGDLAWLLVLENLIFTTEAEVRWLDHIEQAVVRASLSRPAGTEPGAAAGPTPGRAVEAAGRPAPSGISKEGSGR